MANLSVNRSDAAFLATLNAADSAIQPGDAITLSGGYEESGSTLTQSVDDLVIPIDGKTYTLTPSQSITNITHTKPTAPACSGCTVYVTQGETGYAVSYPAAWRWPNGMKTDISTVANSVTRLILSTDPAGNVHADAEVRSVV